MFSIRTWKTIFLLLLFICTFSALMPPKLSNAATAGESRWRGMFGTTNQQESPLSPLSPLLSALAVPEATSTEESNEVEDKTEAKAAAINIEGPITIGTDAQQTSPVLLGAVLIGLIIVVALVLGRRN